MAELRNRIAKHPIEPVSAPSDFERAKWIYQSFSLDYPGKELSPEQMKEIEQLVEAGKARAVEDEARMAAQLPAIRAAQEKEKERTQILAKEGKVCPKCGFSYAWHGIRCGHCHFEADSAQRRS